MNNLNESLATIVEKIKKFRPLYEKNEMAVRDQIINPILRDLGWNPETLRKFSLMYSPKKVFQTIL